MSLEGWVRGRRGIASLVVHTPILTCNTFTATSTPTRYSHPHLHPHCIHTRIHTHTALTPPFTPTLHPHPHSHPHCIHTPIHTHAALTPTFTPTSLRKRSMRSSRGCTAFTTRSCNGSTKRYGACMFVFLGLFVFFFGVARTIRNTDTRQVPSF